MKELKNKLNMQMNLKNKVLDLKNKNKTIDLVLKPSYCKTIRTQKAHKLKVSYHLI